MIRLQLLTPSSAACTCELPDGIYSVGRTADNHIVVAHPTVSATHCQLLVHNTEVIVRDRSSRNGTFVGRSRVLVQQGIRNDERLRLGDIEFLVHIDRPRDDTGSDCPSSTQPFQRWLRASEQPRPGPPRFPFLFVFVPRAP